MQIGFLLIESGSVRKKNDASVAFKNLFDYFVCFYIFYFWGGYFLYNPIIPADGISFISHYIEFYSMLTEEQIANIFFQSAFGCTFCTIVSGSVAERMNSKAYILITVLTSIFIYPFLVNTVWHESGYLQKLGFEDLAGGAPIHIAGGLCALIICLLIGPRDKIIPGKNQNLFNSDNVSIVFGGFILAVGWIGFTSGVVPISSGLVPKIVVNTCIAGSIGFIIAFFKEHFFEAKISIANVVNGSLIGFVIITPAAHIYSVFEVIIAVAIGTIIAIIADIYLKRKIDDVVGAVSVHFVGGIIGILIMGIISSQVSFVSQLIGVVFTIVFTTLVLLILYYLTSLIYKMRSSIEDETIGLNYSEFGIKDEYVSFYQELDKQVELGTYGVDIEGSPHTLMGDIVSKYNNVSKKFKKSLDDEKELRDKLIVQSNLAATGELASGVAHEINNPLAIIKTTLFALKKTKAKDKLTDERFDKFTDDISRTLTRIEKIISSLKNLSRNADHLKKEQFEIGEIVEEVKGIISLSEYKHKIELSWNIDDALLNERIYFNRIQLSQILVNIITNAFHAVEHFERPWVKIIMSSEEHFLNVRIVDSGSGIDQEVLTKIFNPFFSTKDVGKGTGLGLSLVKKIMDNHEGEIYYDKYNQNTSFVLKIPRSSQ